MLNLKISYAIRRLFNKKQHKGSCRLTNVKGNATIDRLIRICHAKKNVTWSVSHIGSLRILKQEIANENKTKICLRKLDKEE